MRFPTNLWFNTGRLVSVAWFLFLSMFYVVCVQQDYVSWRTPFLLFIALCDLRVTWEYKYKLISRNFSHSLDIAHSLTYLYTGSLPSHSRNKRDKGPGDRGWQHSQQGVSRLARTSDSQGTSLGMPDWSRNRTAGWTRWGQRLNTRQFGRTLKSAVMCSFSVSTENGKSFVRILSKRHYDIDQCLVQF